MMRRRASSVAMAILPGMFFGLMQTSAQAQLSAWLDFDGAIKGEATDSRHKEWIEIQSFVIGIERDMSAGGGGTGREASRPALSELTLTKSVDAASPALFIAAAGGIDSYPMVTLDLNIGGEQPIVRLELEDVLVSGQTFAAASGGEPRPTESISLNFTKVTFTYFDPNFRAIFASYDIVTDKTSSGGTSQDSDNDGMLDSWETANGLSIGSNDAGGDLDGDGLTNLQEYQLGTDPRSANSYFKASLSPAPASPDNYQLNWNSVPGKTYVIEWSPDLKTPFATVRSVTATGTSTTENVTRTGNTGFYRVRPQ